MSKQDNARRAPIHYVATARACCFDLAATAFLLVSASLMAGRIWRFPFDDEIATLSKIEPDAMRDFIIHFPATDDIHPPFSYFFFYGLRQLGCSDAAMRLCSLVLTFVALALCQILILSWLGQRSENDRPAAATRVVASLAFGLMALTVSLGDALRWYPVFAVLIALFVVLYLVPRREWHRLWSAVALGLAASTDFSAALIVPPFLIYRHILQRRFRWSFDLAYWLFVAAGAAVGFCSAYYIFTYRSQAVRSEFGGGIRAVLTDVLGFFGGDALGISQAWIIIPLVVIFALAVISEIDWQKPAKPTHLLLLMLSAPALMALAGFFTPRSFLYLTPVVAGLITMFFDRQLRQGHLQRAMAAIVFTLAVSVATIANLISGTHPFKRNSVIPYQAIFDFIDQNANGSALIVSTDPVVPWVLRTAGEYRCAGYFFDARRCLELGRRYDSIFVVFGHHDRSDDRALMDEFHQLVTDVTAGRSKRASMPVGHDSDAALKTRLTSVPLDPTILTVDFYR